MVMQANSGLRGSSVLHEAMLCRGRTAVVGGRIGVDVAVSTSSITTEGTFFIEAGC